MVKYINALFTIPGPGAAEKGIITKQSTRATPGCNEATSNSAHTRRDCCPFIFYFYITSKMESTACEVENRIQAAEAAK
jgi:hypothetical protein